MLHPARKTLLGLVLVGGLILGVTAAQAANIAPNPGFETDCAGIPCNWSANATFASTISRDTNNPHTGSASLAITSNSVVSAGSAISDCITASASTTYNLGFWYRTNATGLALVAAFIGTYTSTDCSGTQSGPPSSATTISPDSTGNWTLVTGQTATDVGVQSVKLFLDFTCSAACGTKTVNFDDVALQTEPLAVTLASFQAHRVTPGVLLRWRTGTDAELLGFQVYRSDGRSWQRISHSLVAAKESVSGASYRFLDRTAKRGVSYRYRIKAVNRDGTESWFGPVRVT